MSSQYTTNRGPQFLINSSCRFLTYMLQIDNLFFAVHTFASNVCCLFVAFLNVTNCEAGVNPIAEIQQW